MKKIALLAVLQLAACGSSTSGPGESSFGGLTYDVRNGGKFVGLPVTSTMPTSGTATYNGVLRMNASTANYFDGTSKMTVDFATKTGQASGTIDFKGERGLGVYQFDRPVTINGSRFSSAFEAGDGIFRPAHIIGNFYGPDAAVVGANVNGVMNSVPVSGVMIAKTN